MHMNILIISPFFSPFTGVGALRMNSLASFLAEKNANIFVLKLSNKNYDKKMTSLHLLSKNFNNIKCFDFELIINDTEKTKENIKSKIEEICKENKINCIVLSCGPYYTIKPIIEIKNEYKIPLIVDYRDLWLYDPRPYQSIREYIGRTKNILVNKKYELDLMNCCDAFVTISEKSLDTMTKHYPNLEFKSKCIYNGYEKIKDSSYSNYIQQDDYVKIVFLGKLSYYSNKGADKYFKAIGTLIKDNYKIKIIHIGEEEEQIKNLLIKNDIDKDTYISVGQLDYNDALSITENCDICGAVINYASGLGTKVFDYIYCNKPIVAVAPRESEFEMLISEFENKFICQTSEGIYNSIKKIVDEKIKVLTQFPEKKAKYSREHQNEQFEILIKSQIVL